MQDLNEIRGLRLLTSASCEVVEGDDAPIFTHGRCEEPCSEFEVLFGALFDHWRDCFVVNSFYRSLLADGTQEDSANSLGISYGSPEAIHSVGPESGLVILRGHSLPDWAAYCGGEWWQLLILDELIPFEDLSPLYFGGIAEGRWPPELRTLLAEYDGSFWQIFSRDHGEIDYLESAHRVDRRIELFSADVGNEYPHPSGKPLEKVRPSPVETSVYE